jgi:YHS domain-containing protein
MTQWEVAIMLRDPVCQMQIDAGDVMYTSEYRGETYYFCSETCKAEFDSDPGAFSGRLAEARYGDLPYGEPLG